MFLRAAALLLQGTEEKGVIYPPGVAFKAGSVTLPQRPKQAEGKPISPLNPHATVGQLRGLVILQSALNLNC